MSAFNPRCWPALVLSLLILAGCATVQPPVSLDTTKLPADRGKIGVAISPLPVGDTLLPGASCLLCLAVAAAANSSLTTHAKTLPDDELKTLRSELFERLKAKGYDALDIAEPVKIADLPKMSNSAPNGAQQDFSALRARYGIDRLLMIDVSARGFERTYSAYVPTSDPRGIVFGAAYLVNLQTRTYEWYVPLEVRKPTDKQWDEPPSFPGLTNAYFQAVEGARDAVLGPWSR